MKFFITPKPPFNFDLVGSLYSRFPVQCVDYYSHGVYERALKIKDKIQLINVRSVGSVEKPKLSIEVLPDKAGKSLIEEKIGEKYETVLTNDPLENSSSFDIIIIVGKSKATS